MSHLTDSTGIETHRAAYSCREAAAVLVAVIAVTLALSLVTTPLSQVADPVRKSFGINDVQFSFLLGTLFAIPSMAMTVAGGWLADRISRRRLLVAAMLCWTGGAVWSAFASSYYELAMARFVIAAAAGIKFPLVMTWVSDAYPPERRGKAIGAVFIVVGIGPAIGATLSGLVLHASQRGVFSALPWIGTFEPWRIALFLLALSNLLVVPWILGLRDVRQSSGEMSAEGLDEGRHVHPIWVISAIVLATALLTLADNANLAWLPTVLSRQHGFDAQQVGLVFGLIVMLAGTLGPLLGGLLDGPIYRRSGSSGRMAACAVATLLCAPLLATFASSNSRLLVGALIVGSMLTMLTTTISFVAMQSLLPPRHRGLGIGLSQAVNNLAAASAPTIVAYVAGALPVTPSSLGRGVAIVTVTAFLATSFVSALSSWSLSRREKRLSPEFALRRM